MALSSGAKIWIGSVVLGALVLILLVVVVERVTREHKQETQRKERLAQAYRDSLYREEKRQRELRESVWRQTEYVADRKSGAKAYGVYSPTVNINGLRSYQRTKVTLTVEWTPSLQYEVVLLRFSKEPQTYTAKHDLNDLMQRTIDLPMRWIGPDTSFVTTVQLRFFPKEGKPTLGYIIDRKWESSQVISKLRHPYKTLRLDFSDWYIGDDIYAEIDLAGAEYEIERMRESVRYMYR